MARSGQDGHDIDAVRAFRDQVDDPTLRREVAAFIGQEAVHARVHEAVWAQRRAGGVPMDRYAALVRGFRDAVDPHVPPTLKLATTAALEHYTAVFGRAFLEEDLDGVVGPEMGALLRWHGAEEIEHRSVAFDVLDVVDDRLRLRLAGLVVASTLITVVPAAGVVLFAADELRRRPSWVPRRRNRALLSMAARFTIGLTVQVVRYAAPGFRPADDDLPPRYEAWRAEWDAADT